MTDLVYGCSMMHDELDVAPWVIEHMLFECDRLIVADNASRDGTRELLDMLALSSGGRLSVVDEPGLAFNQAASMNRLADMAAAEGAAWIVPFDADEWWTAEWPDRKGRWTPVPIAAALRAMPAGDWQTTTRTIDLVPQPDDDPAQPNPFLRARHHRPGSLWSAPGARKTAFRPASGRRLVQGNHRLEDAPWAPVGPLRIRHLPYRSLGQARRKLRHGRTAILAANLPTTSGTHWQQLGAMSDADLEGWWYGWTDPVGLEPAP